MDQQDIFFQKALRMISTVFVLILLCASGVIGLTTALELQSQFPNADVAVIAEKFNQETTSDGAAGIFRPGTSFSVHSEEATSAEITHVTPLPNVDQYTVKTLRRKTKDLTFLCCRFIINESYKYYEEINRSFESEATGVSEISGYIFSKNSPELVENDLINNIVPLYRAVTKEELEICPGNWKYGSYFTTVLTECRRFLPWCLQRFQAGKGKIFQRRINSLNDLETFNFDIVFNCLGLGAKNLIKDRKLVPIRGQVIKVSAPWLKNFYYADYDTYIIPGLCNVTLGGCRNYDSYDLSVSPYDSAAIWNRCTGLVPKLKTCRVEREWVGLRPHRDPVRIEAENIKTQSKIIKCIHNYGHGGYGVTTAPGSAKFAVGLGIKFLKGTHKL